jgi:hypothetical protein
MAGDAPDDGIQRPARLHRQQILKRNLGAPGEVFVVDLEPALGLGDDVGERIFQGEAGHVG